jgi:hypothetical protein
VRYICLVLAGSLTCSVIAKPGDRCEPGELSKVGCTSLKGELRVWNGWPPNLRLVHSKGTLGIGPIEDEIYPAELQQFLPGSIKGTFTVCPLGGYARVPYEEQPIPMFCIQSVKNGKRAVEKDGQVKWVSIK